jgi:hypothetical protein
MRLSRLLRAREAQSGQAIALVAVMLLSMMGIVGLAVDVGVVMSARRELVRTTDSAALAAAGALSGTPADTDATRQGRATARAHEYALLQGFNYAASGNSMVISFPNTTPPRKLVQIESRQAVGLAFMKLFGINTAEISSGARLGEAAPLDIVLLMDVSASQCEQTSNTDMTGSPGQWCSRLQNPSSPGTYWSTNWPYYANQATNQDWTPHTTGTRTNWPWKPFADQQDAARYFIDKLDPRYDQLALVSFSSTVASGDSPYGQYTAEARIHQALTTNFAAAKAAVGVSPRVNGQTGVRGLFPAGQTNMARGIDSALNALTTYPPARENAIGVIILLSDGSPTRTYAGTSPSGCSSSSPGNCSTPRQDTMTRAQQAANSGVVIYTVFCGDAAFATNHALMLQWIADITDNRTLEGSYTGTRNLPSGYGPAFDTTWFRTNVSDNFYLASDLTQLQSAYDEIFRKIYTRLVN